jgi:hypothetical protein
MKLTTQVIQIYVARSGNLVMKPTRLTAAKVDQQFNLDRDEANHGYQHEFRDNPNTAAPVDPLVRPLVDSIQSKKDFYSIASCQGHGPTESHPGLSRSSGTGQLLLVLRSRAIQDQLKNVNIPGLQVRPIRAKAIEYTWSYKNRDTVISALQQFLSQFPDQ